MRGAARAIGWEFRWRHRLWLIAFGAYVVVFFAIKLLILGPGRPIRINPPNGLAGFDEQQRFRMRNAWRDNRERCDENDPVQR